MSSRCSWGSRSLHPRRTGHTPRSNRRPKRQSSPRHSCAGATLRPYQRQGVAWLQLLRSAGLGGILADEMGLGKTVQTLAHLALEYRATVENPGTLEDERAPEHKGAPGRGGGALHPSLIVAPTSVAAVWRDEAARFAPELRVLFLTGPERRDHFAEIGAHDIVITTYALLPRDSEVLLGREWHIVVLDEAHAIKNPSAAVSRTAHGIRAQQRLCLTGTPVENHLGDIWSLCAFAVPGLLPDRRDFQRIWRRPIERDGDRERERLLSRRLRPFLLRRTKSEVAQELPARTELVEFVEMAPAQRDLYESVRLAMHDRVRRAIADNGLPRSHIVILDALLKLRQVCCDPRLVRMKTPKTARARSAKLDRLSELLSDWWRTDGASCSSRSSLPCSR